MVIDLHAHIFNVLHLPVRGIFAYWSRKVLGSPWLGIGVGAMFEITALAKGGSRSSPKFMHDTLKLKNPDALRERLIIEIPTEALDDKDVRKAVREVEGGAAKLMLADVNRADRKLVEEIFEKLLRKFERAVPGTIFDEEVSGKESRRLQIAAFLRWVWLMTEPVKTIAETLCDGNPDVGLFIHHMMDMDEWYSWGNAYLDVPVRQQAQMRRIEGESNGRIRGFVAFDPKRKNSLHVVGTALQSGAVGVKVYPPNGYKPIGNKNTKIDRAMASLFDFCVKHDVPILTHCTPSGFEAKLNESGCNADPEFWRPVLANDKWSKLRLCFGHAGGEEGWLGETKRKKCDKELPPFAYTVVDLCRKYENVYAEIALFGGLKDPTKRKVFAKTLDNWAPKRDSLRRKLCFGTDWHMPSMYITTAAQYLKYAREVFELYDLPSWADAFFSKNARAFLRLTSPRSASRGTARAVARRSPR